MTIENPLALLCLITGLVAASFWLEGRYAWASKIGASLLVIIGGALFSNLSLVPLASPVYSAITGPVTSLAIVWLLFAVDFRGLKAAGPRMLAAFGIAVAATAVGAVVAAIVLGSHFGDDTWRLAGVMTGTYAGGSVNFVSVSREVGLTGSLLAAATAADNVMTAVWVVATLVLPVWLAGAFRRRSAKGPPPSAGIGVEPQSDEAPENPFAAEITVQPVSLLTLLSLGLGLLLASEALGKAVPWVPAILWLTTMALVVGQLPWVRRLKGAVQLGLIALNLFFVVIGIYSRFSEILREGMEIFYFTAIVVLIHGVLVYGLSWLLRLDVQSTSVASQAAVGGPSTALALAVSRGWSHLHLPGVMVGLLGYAVGTYLGLGIAVLVRYLTGS